MVRARSSLILVGLLLILLPLLAVLQYRWIGEVSAAERSRLESSLRAASDRIAIDFEGEFFRIANSFQIREGFPQNASGIIDRFHQWSEISGHPRLVAGISLLKIAGEKEFAFYEVDTASRDLQQAPMPRPLENPGDRLRPGPFVYSAGDRVFVVVPIFRAGRPFGGPRPDEMRPVSPDDFRRRPTGSGRGQAPGPDRQGGQGPGPMAEGAAIIELDRTYILNDFVPALAQKHFSTHDESAYRVAVVAMRAAPQVLYSSAGDWTAKDIATPDAAVQLFGPRQGGGRGRGPGLRQQGGLATEPWQFLVKHRAGSLELAVQQVRSRNLAMAFGILLVLGAGLITVVISSQRAHTLGKLQMEFAAGVSHELRTPLAVIRSAAHNLRSGIVRDKQGVEEYAKIVQEEARRLSEMVEEVLLYSETQSGRKKFKLESIDVNEVIDRALTNISSAIDAQQCDWTTHIEPDLPPVKADAAALTQCVQNLLSNAFKYGHNEGSIQIEIAARRESGGEVALSVTDHGPGIDVVDQRHLFEAFYRGKNIGSNVPGNGLGLHLVKRIMQAQGGRVQFSPASHGGASFTLYIPAAS
jgi:signal transduction histidine kinase